MIALAFKRGAGLYSEAIRKLTGSEFSHVELAFPSDGLDNALCYSSREPGGSSLAYIDLSDALVWEIVPLPEKLASSKDKDLYWFCRGSSGRPYDFIGIAGIGTDHMGLHVGSARFCSNEVTNVLQEVCGLWQGIKPWMIAPGGFKGEKDRYGLYELAKAL